MTPAEKLALQYMPYTCPQLDSMATDFIDQLPEKYSDDILKFVEDIKKTDYLSDAYCFGTSL